MFTASRSGDNASSRVLNSQLVEIRGQHAVKHRVAVVELHIDH